MSTPYSRIGAIAGPSGCLRVCDGIEAGYVSCRQERLPHSELTVARARGGDEDKGRWFALSGEIGHCLSQAIRARGSIAVRDMA
jgi:hypothetical protein